MPVNLSIKGVPDVVAERLRERAKRNHRSLQGELRAIIEQAAGPSTTLTPEEVLARARARHRAAGLDASPWPDIVTTIREMREERGEELTKRLARSKRARR